MPADCSGGIYSDYLNLKLALHALVLGMVTLCNKNIRCIKIAAPHDFDIRQLHEVAVPMAVLLLSGIETLDKSKCRRLPIRAGLDCCDEIQ
jgi:hypothetical protein